MFSYVSRSSQPSFFIVLAFGSLPTDIQLDGTDRARFPQRRDRRSHIHLRNSRAIGLGGCEAMDRSVPREKYLLAVEAT